MMVCGPTHKFMMRENFQYCHINQSLFYITQRQNEEEKFKLIYKHEEDVCVVKKNEDYFVMLAVVTI